MYFYSLKKINCLQLWNMFHVENLFCLLPTCMSVPLELCGLKAELHLFWQFSWAVSILRPSGPGALLSDVLSWVPAIPQTEQVKPTEENRAYVHNNRTKQKVTSNFSPTRRHITYLLTPTQIAILHFFKLQFRHMFIPELPGWKTWLWPVPLVFPGNWLIMRQRQWWGYQDRQKHTRTQQPAELHFQ